MEKVGEIYQKKFNTQPNNSRQKFDAAKIYRAIVEDLANRLLPTVLVLNEQNKHQIGQIALWYANDERFKGDLRKGILLRGGVGTGKTKITETIINVVLLAESKIAKFIHTRELQDLYMRQKIEEIDVLKNRFLIVIDDLGVETVEVQYFGNKMEPFNDLFDYRYRHGLQTIITTNLAPSQLKEIYGDRIASRFRETLNDLVLDYKDFRK